MSNDSQDDSQDKDQLLTDKELENFTIPFNPEAMEAAFQAGPYGEIPDPHQSEFNLHRFPECPPEGDVEKYLRCGTVHTTRVKAGIEPATSICPRCASLMEKVTRLRFHRTEMLRLIPGPGVRPHPLYRREVFERCGNEQCPTRY